MSWPSLQMRASRSTSTLMASGIGSWNYLYPQRSVTLQAISAVQSPIRRKSLNKPAWQDGGRHGSQERTYASADDDFERGNGGSRRAPGPSRIPRHCERIRCLDDGCLWNDRLERTERLRA